MRILKLLGIGFWMFILLWPQMTFSQEAEVKKKKSEEKKAEEKKAEAIRLEDMFVTAFYGDAVTITPTRTIIDVDKFVKSGRVERVEDILMHLAGIDVMRTSGLPDPQQVVLLRGFDDSRYVVAIDGRQITAPTAGMDTFVDWSSLTTADIEKIEVIRGGSSALYENAMGGIINIVTKKGTKRDTLVPKVSIQADYGSYETHGERITVDGGVGQLTYFFNYGFKESDGYLRNNNWRSEDYAVRLAFTTLHDEVFTLAYKGSALHLGYPVVNDPSRSDYDPSYPTLNEDAGSLKKFRNVAYPDGKSEKDKETDHFDIMYDRPVGETGALRLHLYESRGDEDSWTYGYNSAHTSFAQQYSGGEGREERQRGATLRYRFDPWENNTLTLGYDHRRMEVESMEDLYRINAVYFDDLWGITPKLSLNLGLRFDHVREWTYPMSNYPVPGARERNLMHHELWLPKSTLSYNFSPETKAYVSVNREFHLRGC